MQHLLPDCVRRQSRSFRTRPTNSTTKCRRRFSPKCWAGTVNTAHAGGLRASKHWTYIEAEAAHRGLTNVRVITCDMNRFDIGDRFDRIVSVEMFEHMRNWPEMLRRVSGWLRPGGRFFMHVFVHRSTSYPFVERNASDWMSRHFFSGGMMPSDDLALHFQDDLRIVRRWRWDGTHYERTANAWLANMDTRRAAVWPILEEAYGREHAAQWWMRWRIFFMSCAELFGFERGQQWWVSHYLFERRA